MTELQQQLRAYIAREANVPAERIAESTPLVSSGLVDSFMLVGLVTFIEDAAGVRIPAAYAAVEHLDSLALIEQLVAKVRAAR